MFTLKKSKLFILLLILTLVIAACGGGDGDSDSDDSGDAGDTSAQTDDSGGDEGGDSGSVELTESITSENFGLTISYPADWTATEDDFFLSIGNTDNPADVTNRGNAGVVAITVLVNEVGESPDLETIIRSLATDVGEGIDVQTMTIGEYDAALARVRTGTYAAAYALVDLGDGRVALFSAYVNQDETSEYEDTVMAIIGSVTVAE